LRELGSVAFSTDGQLLAREVYEHGPGYYRIYGPIIEPWDMGTGKLHEAPAGKRYELPENAVITSPPPVEDLEFLKFQNRYVKCKEISVLNNEWICYKGRKILWLPPKYRAYRSAASDTTVALGHEWGGVTFIKFDFSASDQN
jgi:hypothetical protein